jgi:hypothetical protein
MIEKIYTIPVNEAFDLYSGCPHCALYKKLEDNELDIILGAAMMEPDTRIQTNLEGFCGRHFDMMFNLKNRLGLALMIESHLSENINKMLRGGLAGKPKNKKLEKNQDSCYVCSRINHKLTKMLETTALLWESERDFKEKLANQPYFCVQHFAALLTAGEYTLHKRVYPEYADACRKVMTSYSEKLLADVSWFVKKFDYNYHDEPWGDSKDAVERAIRFLREYKTLETLRK